MAQSKHQTIEGDRTDHPVVCVTTQSETGLLVQTVLDIQDAGYPIFVGKSEEVDSQVVDVLSRSGVSVITLPDRDSEDELFEEMIPYIRHRGYPGAVLHTSNHRSIWRPV